MPIIQKYLNIWGEFYKKINLALGVTLLDFLIYKEKAKILKNLMHLFL
jgi:hypothetical protein